MPHQPSLHTPASLCLTLKHTAPSLAVSNNVVRYCLASWEHVLQCACRLERAHVLVRGEGKFKMKSRFELIGIPRRSPRHRSRHAETCARRLRRDANSVMRCAFCSLQCVGWVVLLGDEGSM